VNNIIHGHTPTFLLEKYYEKKDKDFVNHELLKRCAKTNEVFYYEHFKENRIMAINIDLGLVYNKSLGALIIPENDEEFEKCRRYNYTNTDLLYYQFNISDGGFRNKYNILKKTIPNGLKRILVEPQVETNDAKSYVFNRNCKKDEESHEIIAIRKFLRNFWAIMWDNDYVLIKRVPKGKNPDFNLIEKKREFKIYFKYCDEDHPVKNGNLPEQDDEYNIFFSPAKYIPFDCNSLSDKADGSEFAKDKFANTRFLNIELTENVTVNYKKLEDDVNAGIIPKPSIVVQPAQDEYNIFWKLKLPLTDINEHQSYLKKLCNKYNGNCESIDSIRMFRLPGYKNLEKDYLVNVLYMSDIIYDIEEFENI
jgi:hypothetical protein